MSKKKFKEQLEVFLENQPPERIAEWLVSVITNDKVLAKHWQIKLLLASGKPSDFKKLLTQALPRKELLVTPYLWRKVGLYFHDATTLFAMAFEQLDQPSCELTNEQQFNWLMQAFERLNWVLETIDDSGGYRLPLVEQLSQRLIDCFHRLDWPLEQKARWLREYQMAFEVFPYIPEHFMLSDDLMKAYTSMSG